MKLGLILEGGASRGYFTCGALDALLEENIIAINNEKYMDGGITIPIPVDESIRSGCNKNIVILTRERGYHKEMEKSLLLAAKLYKKYPKFSECLLNRTEAYNNNLLRVKELEVEGKVFVIAPESMDGFKRTESNSEKLEQIYNDGYKVTKNILPQLIEYLKE